MSRDVTKPLDFVQPPRTVAGGFMRPNRVPDVEHEILMQEFVHAHLMTILQPFNEQMQNLQEGLQKVTLQSTGTAAEVTRHREQISTHHKMIAAFDKTTEELSGALQELQKEVRVVSNKHEALSRDHYQVKNSLEDAESRLRSATAQIEDLFGGQTGVVAQLERLNTGLADIEQHVGTVVESRLNHLHGFCRDIRTEQTNLSEAVSDCQTDIHRNQENIKQQQSKIVARQGEDDEKFACLSQHAKGFEAKLSQLLADLKSTDEVAKATEKETQRAHMEVAKLRSTQQLYAEYSEIFLAVKENSRRVGKLEDTVQLMNSRNPVEISIFQDTIQKIQAQVDDNETKIQSVDRFQASTTVRLDSLGRSIDGFGSEIKGLERRCGALDGDIQTLQLWQHGATEKFEEHTLRNLQNKGDLQKLQVDLEAKGGYIIDLREEIALVQRTVTRIDGNVDVMQKYFTGFGKGLQETTRCVSTGEVVTPRNTPPRPQSATVHATGLPTLPLTGSGSPPRRRPWSSKENRTRDLEGF